MPRRRLFAAALALVVIAVAGIMAMRMLAPPPEELDLAREKPGVSGVFIFAMAPESGEARQGELHKWILTLTTPDGQPVENADIRIDGGMPQHGHGLPTAPQATGYLGEGRHRIEGVRFNMGGWWVLKVEASKDGQADTAEFNLVL